MTKSIHCPYMSQVCVFVIKTLSDKISFLSFHGIEYFYFYLQSFESSWFLLLFMVPLQISKKYLLVFSFFLIRCVDIVVCTLCFDSDKSIQKCVCVSVLLDVCNCKISYKKNRECIREKKFVFVIKVSIKI